VLAGLAYALHALATLVVPALFAVLLGATFMPAVDWLERHHVGRGWGALIVTVLIVAGGFALLALMTVGIVRQWPTIEHQIEAAVGWINDSLQKLDIDPSLIDSAKETLTGSVGSWAQGIFGGALRGISTLATFAFGAFIGLNILVYVLVGGRRIGRWASEHMGPVPPPVGYSILADSARFLRGYIWGSTLIGLFNGAVVGVGALIIGVPLAFTIFVVQWLTNYIPTFGAFIGGAFAVLIALGTGGVREAVWMLIFVLIANGPLQTVVSQFALGASLKLSGLVVLFATTGGAILAGALGGIFAAPFVKIGVDAYRQLKDAGLFDDRPAVGGDGGQGPPAPDVGGPADGPADGPAPPGSSGPPGTAAPAADA
jgi:predicted PurR-regulated permease PerM